MIRGDGPALVIGAGIAGPVVAMALQRIGLDCEIYEAYPSSAHGVGAFMNVATNGLDALAAVDADRAVLAAGFPTREMVMWNGAGRRLGEMPGGLPRPDGSTTVTLQRAALYRVLYEEAVRRGVRFSHGKRLQGADSRPDGVIAKFTDGSSAQGRLLVGADGLRSVTRALVAPSPPPPEYVGLIGLGGQTRGLSLEVEPGVFHFVFGRRAFFGYTARSAEEIWWFANLPVRPEPSPAALAARGPAGWKRHLLELFADDAVPAVPILQATDEALFEPAPMHTLEPVPRWHHDRMVLIGDAAHVTSPSSGQGASLAFEDAVQLARCLRDRDQPAEAFAAYQQLREARVARILQEAKRTNSAKAAGPVGRFFRDLFMSFFLKRLAHKVDQQWLFGHHIEFDQPIPS